MYSTYSSSVTKSHKKPRNGVAYFPLCLFNLSVPDESSGALRSAAGTELCKCLRFLLNEVYPRTAQQYLDHPLIPYLALQLASMTFNLRLFLLFHTHWMWFYVCLYIFYSAFLVFGSGFSYRD